MSQRRSTSFSVSGLSVAPAAITEAQFFDRLEEALGQAVQGGRLAYDVGCLNLSRGSELQVLFRAGTHFRSLRPCVIPIDWPAGIPRPREFTLYRHRPNTEGFEHNLSFEFPHRIQGTSLTVSYDPTAPHSFRVTDETGQQGVPVLLAANSGGGSVRPDESGRTRLRQPDDERRQSAPDPWETLADRHPPGTRVTGTVSNLTVYGAYVEVEDGVHGLLHRDEMSWVRKVSHPREVVQIGETITCVVLSVDRERKSLTLGLKQLTPDPWAADIPARYTFGQKVRGVVSKLVASGAFVELEPGVEGMLHQSDMSADGANSPVQVKVGDKVEVRVLRVYAAERMIALTMRRVGKPSLAYISYASADREFVSRLTSWLRTQGWETWEYQQSERSLSQTLANEIGSAVERADVVLVVGSPSWVTSSHCQVEWNAVATLSKPVEVLTVRPFDPSFHIAHHIDGRQHVDFTRDEEAAFRQLADLLRLLKPA